MFTKILHFILSDFTPSQLMPHRPILMLSFRLRFVFQLIAALGFFHSIFYPVLVSCCVLYVPPTLCQLYFLKYIRRRVHIM